jgi:hypothetical protein
LLNKESASTLEFPNVSITGSWVWRLCNTLLFIHHVFGTRDRLFAMTFRKLSETAFQSSVFTRKVRNPDLLTIGTAAFLFPAVRIWYPVHQLNEKGVAHELGQLFQSICRAFYIFIILRKRGRMLSIDISRRFNIISQGLAPFISASRVGKMRKSLGRLYL